MNKNELVSAVAERAGL
nr:RecName: Full=DNA-binding protein H3-RL [Rhizobium leguminosarum]